MDINISAFRLVQEATAGVSEEDMRKRVVTRKGGLIGGRARAASLSPDRRREIALKANQARWQDNAPKGGEHGSSIS